MVSKHTELAQRAVNALRADKVLFYEVNGKATPLSSEYELSKVVREWGEELEGEPWLGWENGKIREHFAASPLTWVATTLLAVALVVVLWLLLTDSGQALLKAMPSLARASDSGFLFGFVFTCGTVVLMFARVVKVVTIIPGRSDPELKVGFGVRVASLGPRGHAINTARRSLDWAREAFFKHNSIFMQGHYLVVGGKAILAKSVMAIEPRWRPVGLFKFAGYALASVAAYFLLQAPEYVRFHVPSFVAGLGMPFALPMGLGLMAALVTSALTAWGYILAGGWAEEQYSVVVRTSDGRKVVAGKSEFLFVESICSDLAALLAPHDVEGAQA